MATIGLRDLFYAPIITTVNGADNYGTPVRMAKAINADLTIETAEATLYADDSIDEIMKSFVGGTLTLNINDLEPNIQAVLLGQTQDDNGVAIASEDDEPPYVAIGFRATKPRGKFKHVWLYKVKFAIPNETYQTKGSSMTFNTPTIVGSFIKRPDGRWKVDHTGTMTDQISQNWLDEVYEPEFNSSSNPEPDLEPASIVALNASNVEGGQSGGEEKQQHNAKSNNSKNSQNDNKKPN